jgi:hypothetical protein
MLPRVGSALSHKLWRHISQADDPLKSAGESDAANLMPAGARPFYVDLADLIGKLTQLDSPAEIIDMTVEGFYGDYVVSHYDGADLRKEDLRALANFAAQYNNLEAFLTDISLAGDYSGETIVQAPPSRNSSRSARFIRRRGWNGPLCSYPGSPMEGFRRILP